MLPKARSELPVVPKLKTVPTLGEGRALPLLTTTGMLVMLRPFPAYGAMTARFTELTTPSEHQIFQ